MGDTKAGSQAHTAQIRVLRVMEPPASILIEVQGTKPNGEQAEVAAHFDLTKLCEDLFPGLFVLRFEEIMREAEDRMQAKLSMPLTLAEVEAISGIDGLGTHLPSLKVIAEFMRKVGKLGAQDSLMVARAIAGRQLGLTPEEPLPPASEKEPPAPAPGTSEGAAPSHADASMLEDRVSNSLSDAGGVDTSLLSERSSGHEALTA